MAASINDKLIKQGNGTQPIPTQLTAEKAVGASTASLAAATGWDTTTAKHVRMYKTKVVSGQTVPDQSTISFYKATLSGTTLSNLTLIWSATGTDQKYDAGDTVDLAITSGWVDDLIEALLVSHDQSGNITTEHTAYTPTVTAGTNSFTTASATGRYTRVGKTIFYEVIVTITTKGTGVEVRFTLPSAPAQPNYVVVFGREDSVTGKMVQGKTLGSSISLNFYDNSATGGDGHIYRVNGWYEVA